jgi:hypothetical protein
MVAATKLLRGILKVEIPEKSKVPGEETAKELKESKGMGTRTTKAKDSENKLSEKSMLTKVPKEAIKGSGKNVSWREDATVRYNVVSQPSLLPVGHATMSCGWFAQGKNAKVCGYDLKL